MLECWSHHASGETQSLKRFVVYSVVPYFAALSKRLSATIRSRLNIDIKPIAPNRMAKCSIGNNENQDYMY